MASLYIYIIFGFIAGCQGTGPVKYVGCMIMEGQDENKASNERGSFTVRASLGSPVTIVLCVDYCFTNRYRFAAMQRGKFCYCGSHTQGLEARTDDYCYERCSGNCRQRCGGLATMSVYTTEYVREPDLTYPIDLAFSGKINCFERGKLPFFCDSQGQKLKPPLKTPRMTIQLCTLYCYSGSANQRMPLAIVKLNDECCCGTIAALTKAKQLPHVRWTSHCNQPCAGKVNPSYCVGKKEVAGRTELYISAFDTKNLAEMGMPNEPFGKFQESNGWLHPIYPPAQEFELKDGVAVAKRDEEGIKMAKSAKDMPELEGKGGDKKNKQMKPVVDPVNTGVKVVDLPEVKSEEDTSVVIIVMGTLAGLLLLTGIAFFIFKRRRDKKTSGTEKDSEIASLQQLKQEQDETVKEEEDYLSDKANQEETGTVEIFSESESASQTVTLTDDESATKPLLSLPF